METADIRITHELTIYDVQELSVQLAEQIETPPDAVVFVGRGGYLIGDTLAKQFHTPLLEIRASRYGGTFKKRIAWILKKLPLGLKIFLRNIEMKSKVHQKYAKRKIITSSCLTSQQNFSRLLLVDDSVDTGHTILACKNELLRLFPDAQIEIASFAVWKASESLVSVDYHLFDDLIISFPWSSDSKEYGDFIALYEEGHRTGQF